MYSLNKKQDRINTKWWVQCSDSTEPLTFVVWCKHLSHASFSLSNLVNVCGLGEVAVPEGNSSSPPWPCMALPLRGEGEERAEPRKVPGQRSSSFTSSSLLHGCCVWTHFIFKFQQKLWLKLSYSVWSRPLTCSPVNVDKKTFKVVDECVCVLTRGPGWEFCLLLWTAPWGRICWIELLNCPPCCSLSI